MAVFKEVATWEARREEEEMKSSLPDEARCIKWHPLLPAWLAWPIVRALLSYDEEKDWNNGLDEIKERLDTKRVFTESLEGDWSKGRRREECEDPPWSAVSTVASIEGI